MLKVLQKSIEVYIKSFEGLSKDIWLLSLMTLINRSGTMVIIFMTIYLTEELNWSLTHAGIAMSLFGLGSVFGSLIGGWLTDRVGYYPTMFWTLLVGGMSFFLLMQVESFIPYCATVLLVSTINDAFRPASMASISSYSKPENQNRSLSLIRLAINLGFAVGVGAAGLISEYFGFKLLFVIDGVTCMLAALFLKMALVEKADQAKSEESEITKRPEESAYRDKLYLAFGFFILLNGIVFAQLWNTIPVYFTDILGLGKDSYGWIMLANGFLIFVLEMPIVYVFERRFERISLIIAGVIMIALSYIMFNLTSYWQLAILVCIILISIGEIIAFPFSNAFALSRSKPGRRGEYMGVYTMAWSIAMIVAPTLGMWIAESYGFTTLWYTITGIGIIACFGFYLIKLGVEREGQEVEALEKTEVHWDIPEHEDILDIQETVSKN